MDIKIKIFIVACMMAVATMGHAQKLVEDLSDDEVTIVFKNDLSQSVTRGDHKQSGRMINYEPGKSITIVTARGDTLTYQQSDIYRIIRKRPQNLAFTSEFGEGGPSRGYHGEYNFEIMPYNTTAIGFSTVQGYQFLPWLRVGIGYMYLHGKEEDKLNDDGTKTRVTAHSSTLFGDAKVFFTRTLFNPFLDVRLGASLNHGEGFFYNASLGCRFGLRSSKRLAFNIGLGLTNVHTGVKDSKALLLMRAGFEF